MGLVKKCRHGRGKTGRARVRAWRQCGCTWYGDLRIDGARVYAKLGPDEASARAEFARLVAEREAGRLHAREAKARHTISGIGAAWLEHNAPSWKPGTHASHATRLNLLTAWFGDTDVADIDASLVREFWESLTGEYSRNYCAGVRATLSEVLRYAAERGIIKHPPVMPRMPKGKSAKAHNPNHVAIGDIERVIADLPQPFRDAAELGLLAGMRLAELCGLTVGAVHLDGPTPTVEVVEQVTRYGRTTPKNVPSIRVVPLTERAAEILRERTAGRAPGEPVFPMDHQQATYQMREALKRQGLYVRGRGWHMLRHGNTTLRNLAGEALRDSAAALGHGANHAQTLGYGWQAERGEAPPLDSVREQARHARPSRARGAAGGGASGVAAPAR